MITRIWWYPLVDVFRYSCLLAASSYIDHVDCVKDVVLFLQELNTILYT